MHLGTVLWPGLHPKHVKSAQHDNVVNAGHCHRLIHNMALCSTGGPRSDHGPGRWSARSWACHQLSLLKWKRGGQPGVFPGLEALGVCAGMWGDTQSVCVSTSSHGEAAGQVTRTTTSRGSVHTSRSAPWTGEWVPGQCCAPMCPSSLRGRCGRTSSPSEVSLGDRTHSGQQTTASSPPGFLQTDDHV